MVFTLLLQLYPIYLNHSNLPNLKFYQNFPHFLRKDILSFASKNTLLQYAQCSKQCSQEIGAHNIDPAYLIGIKDLGLNDAILLEVQYSQNGKPVNLMFVDNPVRITEQFRKLHKIDEVVEGDPIQNVMKFIDDNSRFVKGPATKRLQVDCKKWPKELLEFRKLQNVKELSVTMYRRVFDDFMEYLNGIGCNIRSLTIKSGDRFLPAHETFSTPFFKKLRVIELIGRISTRKFDFLESEESNDSEEPITDEMIQKKLDVWLMDRSIKRSYLKIVGRNQRRDMNVILASYESLRDFFSLHPRLNETIYYDHSENCVELHYETTGGPPSNRRCAYAWWFYSWASLNILHLIFTLLQMDDPCLLHE